MLPEYRKRAQYAGLCHSSSTLLLPLFRVCRHSINLFVRTGFSCIEHTSQLLCDTARHCTAEHD
ncbi:hypothetical protein M3J09_007548 [Ascochyta lentis]